MVVIAAGLFAFLALATGSVAVLAWPRWRQEAFNQRVRGLRPGLTAGETQRTIAPSVRRSRSSIPTLRRWLNDSAWAEATATQLQQANIPLRAGEYLLIRLLLAMLSFLVPIYFLRAHPAGLAVGALGAGIGYLVPALYAKSARRRRLARIESQLIEFLPALASSLRSGFAFQPGVATALQQVGPPLAEELTVLLHDVELGATTQDALLDLGRRVGSTDLDMVITAILVQRATGANLPEILEQTAETLRERERIRGDVQTFTAQQRLTGVILSVYPAVVGLILLAIMPSVWLNLFTEPVGQVLLGIAVGLQVLGFFAIRRSLQVDV